MKKNKKMYRRITPMTLLQGFVCYFGWIGALIMSIIGADDYVIRFHARQAGIYFVLTYGIRFILGNLGLYTLGIHNIITIISTVIFFCGTYHVATRQVVKYPIIGDLVR